MTAYPRAFNLAGNLAECVLFVLFYERQTPVFVLHLFGQTRARSCCLSGTNSSKLFAPYFLFNVLFRTSAIIYAAHHSLVPSLAATAIRLAVK
jgi:hypothetical protein